MRLINTNVLLDAAMDESRLTGKPLPVVIQEFLTTNKITLPDFQKERLESMFGTKFVCEDTGP